MEATIRNIIFGSQITVLVLCIYILSPEYLRPPSLLSYRDVSNFIDEFFKTYPDPLQLTLFIYIFLLSIETESLVFTAVARAPSTVTSSTQ